MTPTTPRQLAERWGLDPWAVLIRPLLHARADAVHALMATVRADAQAAQGKTPRDRRGRFVAAGGGGR
jgi:hypothetical protein